MSAPPASALDFERVPFERLEGWSRDAQSEAMTAFRRSCTRILAGDVKGGSLAARFGPALTEICHAAAGLPEPLDDAAARAFFEAYFDAFRIAPTDRPGFVTAYFEPSVRGSLQPTARYKYPLYAAPDDLLPLGRGPRPEGLPPGLQGARRTEDGLVPYATRAEIEAGALRGRGLELVWLESPVDAFYVHIQGSARIVLPDGGEARVTFAAKNGHPYTAIGRVLLDRGEITREKSGMKEIRAWLETHAGEAQAVLNENRSFIFFTLETDMDPGLGPSGAQGVPLTPGRSIAVDDDLHLYGTPVWIAADLPDGEGGTYPFRRLTVAQDTGSAIKGPTRADLFLGHGDAAGRAAGDVRHQAAFVVLLPRGAVR